jgi:hypothetical protein
VEPDNPSFEQIISVFSLYLAVLKFENLESTVDGRQNIEFLAVQGLLPSSELGEVVLVYRVDHVTDIVVEVLLITLHNALDVH